MLTDKETYHNRRRDTEPGIHVNIFGNEVVSPRRRRSTFEKVMVQSRGPNRWNAGRRSLPRFQRDAESYNHLSDTAFVILL
jgi:hypothetical protein